MQAPKYNSYDRWQYAWSIDCSTSLHPQSRAPCASLTHTNQVVAQCRAVLSVIPRPRRRTHCRATGDTSHAAAPRVPTRCNRSRAVPTSRSRPTPVPQSPPSDRPAERACTACRRGCPCSAARPMQAQTRAASPPCIVLIHMLHKFVPQLRAQVRLHLPARLEPGALTSALQRCAARRRARRASVGEVAAVL